APVSRFGQKFWVKTKYATAVAAPTTLAVDPARWRVKADGSMIDPVSASKLSGGARNQLVNQEQLIHTLYAYLYVVDKYEGLILVNAATLLDGDPLNNYLRRALDPKKYPGGAFNPGGALNDANNITIAGHNAYITTAHGLVVGGIDDPLTPRITAEVNDRDLKNPRAIAIQFRYGFIVDDEGMKVLDLSVPASPKLVPGALIPLAEPRDVYVARTHAYVANGKEGIAIIDVEQPETPRLDQTYNA